MAHQSLYFEELSEGQQFRSCTRTIAEYDLYVFAGLTGDLTDFHISTQAAEQSIFGRRPAHGMLVISIANGLYNRIGVTDETGLALAGVEWRFLAPCFIGDTIHLQVTVEKKHASRKLDRGVVTWYAQVGNQNGDVLCEGRMVRMVRRKPVAASS